MINEHNRNKKGTKFFVVPDFDKAANEVVRQAGLSIK
jgi:hypothetical protein